MNRWRRFACLALVLITLLATALLTGSTSPTASKASAEAEFRRLTQELVAAASGTTEAWYRLLDERIVRVGENGEDIRWTRTGDLP